METLLRDLCKAHDLTTVSVMMMAGRHNHISVYLHWQGSEGVCATGFGITFDEAFAMACEDMEVKRDVVACAAVEGRASAAGTVGDTAIVGRAA